MTRNFILVFIILFFSGYQLSYGQFDDKEGVSKNERDTVVENEVVSWEIDEFYDTNRVVIDTNYYNRHLFNPNLGNIYLSSYGTPLLVNDFTERPEFEFLFNRHLSKYFLTSSFSNYYRTNTPFTYLKFDTEASDDVESSLKLFHTQNVNKLFNFGIDAKIISSQKFYERETSAKSHHIRLFASYEDTTYQLYANFVTNKYSHNQIGGIEDVKEIQTTGYLDDATTTVKSKEINLQQKKYFFQKQKRRKDRKVADTNSKTFSKPKSGTISYLKDSTSKILSIPESCNISYPDDSTLKMLSKPEPDTTSYLKDSNSKTLSKLESDTISYLNDSSSKKILQPLLDTASYPKDSIDYKGESMKRDSITSNLNYSENEFGFIRSGFGVLHDFSYRIYDYKYVDQETQSGFYQPFPIYIDSTKTKDKASQRVLSNRLSLFFKSKYFDVNTGLEHNYTNYSYIHPFEMEDSVINKYDMSDNDYHNIRFSGNIQLKWDDSFSFKGSLDSWFFGYHKGDLNIDVQLRKDLSNSYIIARGNYFLKEPNYFLNQYNSNYFRWNKSFDKRNKLSFELEYVNNKFDFKTSVQPMMIKNYIYMDTLATPNQHKPWLRYASVSLEKDFNFWKFHLKNDLQYQFSEYDRVLRLPSFYIHQSLAFRHQFNFEVTGGKLDAQLGIGYYYFTGYKANAYMPALNLFYRQNEDVVGGNPMVNVFANFKLKRTSFYFKAFHANSFIHQGFYYSAPDYPISDFMLKVGVLWTFYD